jgi:hypothetical protein
VHSRCAVRQFPTLHWCLRPDALRLPNTLLKELPFKTKTRLVPPCLLSWQVHAGWWVGGLRESFALLEVNQVLRFPDVCQTEPVGACNGSVWLA